jgi:copper chaperone
MLTVSVPNMECGGCAQAVTRAVLKLDAGAQVKPDVPSKLVEIVSTAPDAAVLEALAKAGFPPVPR